MIAVFDASVLIFLFEKDAAGPLDEATGQPLADCYDRVNHLVDSLTRERTKIIIPTPALGEILVKAGAAGPEWLRIISDNRFIRVAPFDLRSAVEFAAMQRERKASTAKGTEPKAKAKFDDQILAIARTEGAEVIYTADNGLARAATPDIRVVGLLDLPLPPVDPQLSLELDQSRPDASNAEPDEEPRA